MNEILGLKMDEMAGKAFECSCGKKHAVGIRRISVGSEIDYDLVNIAEEYRAGEIFLLADTDTYTVMGRRTEELLRKNSFTIKSYIFPAGNHPLVPDEKALGRLLVEIDKTTSLIMAVGSGTLNDLARMISYKMGIPYAIIGTAPSMDGYASTVSPLIIEGFKKTYEAVYPVAIIADTGVLKNAPMEMIHAGFGDILGKITALTDWELSRKLNAEYYCETSVHLVRNALQHCIDYAAKVANRDEETIKSIAEALILSGIAMGLVGNSRPASGAEHHLAHFWEMDALAKGNSHPLHGNSVGAASVVIASLYEMAADKLPVGLDIPNPVYISGLLRKAGACDNPSDLGIEREVFRQSILHALEIRPRYTIFQFVKEKGLLEEYANQLTQKFY